MLSFIAHQKCNAAQIIGECKRVGLEPTLPTIANALASLGGDPRQQSFLQQVPINENATRSKVNRIGNRRIGTSHVNNSIIT